MLNVPEVSIIMPVYNGARYIEQTLEYLKQQTFENFEVIIIDDHSTDDTANAVSRFCEKDTRFNLHFNIKKGVASARNVGLEKAKGKYIIHYDSDDIIPSDAIMNMYDAIIDNADIVIGDYIVKTGDVENLELQNYNTASDRIIEGLITNKIHGGLWNKLIRKEFYEDLKFDESVNYMEDKLILVQILLRKPRVIVLNKVVYKYIQHAGSITSSLSENSLQSIKKVILQLEKEFENKNTSFDLSFLKIYYKLLAYLNRKSIDNKKDFKEVNSRIPFCKELSIHHRILLFLKVYSFGFISDLFLKLR
ncbi:MAG: hypothetical protein BGO86_05890 [Chryseobacterium sp. 36-9]|nr:MAG: hypothetical protein BGO86_05890 [Chryseobacterium sp. 36-9]